MKRAASHPLDTSVHTRRRIRDDPVFIPDYAPLTSGIYDFSVCSDDVYGKWVRCEKDVSSGKEILIESPLICWPLGCSANSWSSVLFCEHCLRIFQNDDDSSPSSITSISTSENSPSKLRHTEVPSSGFFCSVECHSKATDDGMGWFEIIGGAEGLRKLRESDWQIKLRGNEEVMRCSTPISNESISRYLCALAWRYHRLRKQVDGHIDESVEDEIFAQAGRTFERFVTPAQSSDYDAEQTLRILINLIGNNLSLILPRRILSLIFNAESIIQIWGQLVVNAQRLDIWGSDVNGNLCVLQGAGIFTLQSCFNHSCSPNCEVSCSLDSTLSVTTKLPIAAGEQLTISYIVAQQPIKERRELLAEGYLFWCQCKRCKEEESATIEP